MDQGKTPPAPHTHTQKNSLRDMRKPTKKKKTPPNNQCLNQNSNQIPLNFKTIACLQNQLAQHRAFYNMKKKVTTEVDQTCY